MATIQMQRTVNAPMITKTAIDQKQSLEVVQTMLHSSLSTLSYYREFFADHVFEKQMYEMAEQIHPYEDYAAGKLVKDRSETVQPAITMQTMQRGRSRRADKFLDLLEKGAFTALQAGHLRSLQVYVHTDPECRSEAIETYTFTVSYSPNVESGPAVAGLELDAPGSPLVSVRATYSAFQALLLKLMNVCARLPDLPKQRYISMELFYVPGFEQEQVPLNFVPSTEPALRLPKADGWERESVTLHELGSQHHGSALMVTSLIPAGSRYLAEPPVLPFPKYYQYTTTASKVDLISSTISAGAARPAEVASVNPTDAEVANATTPSTVVDIQNQPVIHASAADAFVDSVATPGPTSDPGFPDSPGLPVTIDPQLISARPDMAFPNDNFNTQSTNALELQDAVRGMMQPVHISQGDTQTQSLAYRPPPPAPTESTESPIRSTVSPEKPATIAAVGIDKPILSPTKALQLQRNESKLHKNALALVKQASGRIKKLDNVLCQCGHKKEEDGMVHCSYCETWQHLPCYGYTATDDPRIPDDHTCYQCLLGDEEKFALAKLQELAVKRRAMDFANQHGLKTQKELGDDLDLDPAVARQVYGYLKNSGFVVPASGSHKAGYSATGKPLLVPVRRGPRYEVMLQTLFDPMMHISHHYQLPQKPTTQLSSLTERLLASQSNDMPPPATPASALRKRKAVTPSSQLDGRASEPVETPSHIRGRPAVAKKQAPNGRVLSGRPAKRPATPSSTFALMRSVQSRFVIDANGLSSSPVSTLGY